MHDTDLKDYEIAFLVKSEEGVSAISSVLAEVGAIIAVGAKPAELRLAYPIEKASSALFGFIDFTAPPAAIARIRDSLSFSPQLLRFLIVTPPPVREAPRSRRPSVRDARQGEQRAAPRGESHVSNEALEQKLEEILG